MANAINKKSAPVIITALKDSFLSMFLCIKDLSLNENLDDEKQLQKEVKNIQNQEDRNKIYELEEMFREQKKAQINKRSLKKRIGTKTVRINEKNKKEKIKSKDLEIE